MIKYKVLYKRLPLVLEGDATEKKTYRDIRIIYDLSRIALPLAISGYRDYRFRDSKSFSISVFCLHFIFDKHVF